MTEQQIIDWIWNRAVDELVPQLRGHPGGAARSDRYFIKLATRARAIVKTIIIECDFADVTPEVLRALRIANDKPSVYVSVLDPFTIASLPDQWFYIGAAILKRPPIDAELRLRREIAFD